jgi:hypothetical protein
VVFEDNESTLFFTKINIRFDGIKWGEQLRSFYEPLYRELAAAQAAADSSGLFNLRNVQTSGRRFAPPLIFKNLNTGRCKAPHSKELASLVQKSHSYLPMDVILTRWGIGCVPRPPNLKNRARARAGEKSGGRVSRILFPQSGAIIPLGASSPKLSSDLQEFRPDV